MNHIGAAIGTAASHKKITFFLKIAGACENAGFYAEICTCRQSPQRKAKRRASRSASDCRKTFGVLERIEPSRIFKRIRRRVRWGEMTFCGKKFHFQSKNRREAYGGEFASPFISLSRPFLTSRGAHREAPIQSRGLKTTAAGKRRAKFPECSCTRLRSDAAKARAAALSDALAQPRPDGAHDDQLLVGGNDVDGDGGIGRGDQLLAFDASVQRAVIFYADVRQPVQQHFAQPP